MASKKSLEPILRLRKCLIRSYEENDAEVIAKEANNPEIAKWMRNTFPHPYSVEDARKWISIATSASPVLNFAICRLDNTVVGSIGLKAYDDIHYRTVEIGYWLGQDHWNQGIATEALSAFTEWTFDNFTHVLRIEAEVFEGNKGSARALDKTGYVFEARKKKAIEKWGVVLDVLIYCTFRIEN
ncbi:Fc.00g108070.m01.CDS01 [Cosmosporella sp. VM-42]